MLRGKDEYRWLGIGALNRAEYIAAPSLVAPVYDWRKCLVLCLPALVLGAVLRLCFVAAIPEAFYGADSPSYIQAADRLWNNHRISVAERRRWLYPLLIVPMAGLPISLAHALPVLQHLLGLATLFGIGWIVGNLTSFRIIWVPVVTLAAAILPQMLWDEHEMISEAVFLALFVLTVSLAMPMERLLNTKGLFWFLVSAASVASVKPHGRGIWLGCVLFAALVTWGKVKWDAKCWGAIAAALLIICTSGEKRQGNWLLLNSALPLVNLEGAKWKPYRDALRNVVMKARGELDQYAWTQQHYKKALWDSDPTKIDPVWAALTTREKEFSDVCAGLAREAILAHPVEFAKLTITKVGIAFANCDRADVKMHPAAFWAQERLENGERWEKSAKQMTLFYKMNQSKYEALMTEREKRENDTVPFLDSAASGIDWIREHRDAAGKHFLSLGWLGILAMAGFLFCLFPARFVATSVVWLPGIFYIATVFAIADRKGEYVQPVEWIGLVLAAIALDSLAGSVVSWRKVITARRVPSVAEALA